MKTTLLALIAFALLACSSSTVAPNYDRAVQGHDKALERLDRE